MLVGALHWTDAVSVVDPHGLALAYLRLFEKLGGRFVQGNAVSLEPGLASAHRAAGPVKARPAVIALGPWADVVTRALGYDLPLAVKRGYHMHYRAAGTRGAATTRCSTPSAATFSRRCGAASASPPAPSSPCATRCARRCSSARAEPIARELFPLAERLDTEAWMGSRPCTPDMMPVIGPAPRHPTSGSPSATRITASRSAR